MYQGRAGPIHTRVCVYPQGWLGELVKQMIMWHIHSRRIVHHGCLGDPDPETYMARIPCRNINNPLDMSIRTDFDPWLMVWEYPGAGIEMLFRVND